MKYLWLFGLGALMSAANLAMPFIPITGLQNLPTATVLLFPIGLILAGHGVAGLVRGGNGVAARLASVVILGLIGAALITDYPVYWVGLMVVGTYGAAVSARQHLSTKSKPPSS